MIFICLQNTVLLPTGRRGVKEPKIYIWHVRIVHQVIMDNLQDVIAKEGALQEGATE